MPATKFDKPVFPGAKLVSATVTVTNTSGSYSNTFIDERSATSMRAFQLEIEDPSVFNDKISITTADGSFTIACDSVAGETDVTIGFLKIADDPTAISSTEFTVLNNRIGDLSDLETTDQTSIVNAVNEVVDAVSDNTQAIATLNSELENRVSYKTYSSGAKTVNANSKLDFSIQVDLTYNNHSHSGIISIDYDGNYIISICKYSLYAGTAYVSVYNPTNNAITTTFTIRVIYS